MRDIYLYKNSTVLRNKLDIREQDLLDEAESNYVSLCLREIVEYPLKGEYDYFHFLQFHKYIFQDVYEWARLENNG